MTKQTSNTDDLMQRFQDIIQQGNMRKLVIKSAEGRVLIETSLTVAAVIAFFLLITRVIVIVAVLGVIAGVVARVQVEIVRELDEDSQVVKTEATVVEREAERENGSGKVEVPVE